MEGRRVGLGFFVAVIGLVLSLLVGGPYIHWPAGYYTDYGLLGAFTGAVGGLALGVALRNKKGALDLALAGFVGFGIGEMLGLPGIVEVLQNLLAEEQYSPGLFSTTEAIGGASLGAALGCLEYLSWPQSNGQESSEPKRSGYL